MTLYEQLKHFGLSDKEAKVYVAALELGPSPVQAISKKAGVNRATTYVQIATLNGRGLMSSYDKGKKRFFVAESPERLMALYEDEMHRLKEKEEVLKEVLPELKRLRPTEGVPTVRLFEGHDGLEAVRQELLKSESKYFEDIHGLEYYNKSVPVASVRRQFERVRGLGIKGRVILSTEDPGKFVPADRPQNLDRRAVQADKYDFPGEIAVFDDKVVMLAYRGDPVAVMIESKEIAQMMRSFYQLAWDKVRENRAI